MFAALEGYGGSAKPQFARLHSTTNAIITTAQLENPRQRLLPKKQLIADCGCS